jgi:hypothetical protein
VEEINGPVYFTRDYKTRWSGRSIKAGTQVIVTRVHTGFLGPFWSGAKALTVRLPKDGTFLKEVPIDHFRR